jgi:hypothetical protein
VSLLMLVTPSASLLLLHANQIRLILSCNSSQALCDKDKLVPGGVVSLKSSACGLRGEMQLTKVFQGCHHLLRENKSILLVPNGAFALEEDGDGYDVAV